MYNETDFFKYTKNCIGEEFDDKFLFYEKSVIYNGQTYYRTSYEGCCYPMYTNYTAINTVICVCALLYAIIICVSIRKGKRIERMYTKKLGKSVTESLV